MKNIALLSCSLLLALLVMPIVGMAQQKTIRLYDKAAPGSESWNWEEKQTRKNEAKFLTLYNIANPSLTVFTPDPAKSNGTGIIVAPGGGFLFLQIENEGYEVAKWLVEKGFTVFVLKYRTFHINNDDPLGTLMDNYKNNKWEDLVRSTIPLCAADGKASIEYARAHSAEFNIQPNRIGIIGFSAGGTVAASTAFDYTKNNRPNFVAPIYPYFPDNMQKAVLPDAPPMFLLAATNDEGGFNLHCVSLYKLWFASKKPLELHLYATGGHGFGMAKQNLPKDNWIERFYEFLQQQGFASN